MLRVALGALLSPHARLRLAGYLHEADQLAVQARRYLADAPGWFPLGGIVLLGHADLARDIWTARCAG